MDAVSLLKELPRPMGTKIHFELELPDGLVDEAFEADLVRGFKEDTALRLFQEGKISSGYAAQLIGISRLEFLSLLQKRGLPFVEYTAADLREDLAAMEQSERHAGRRNT